MIQSLALESEGFTSKSNKSPKAGRGYSAVIEIYYPSAPTDIHGVTMNSDASLEPGSCLSLEPQLVDG